MPAIRRVLSSKWIAKIAKTGSRNLLTSWICLVTSTRKLQSRFAVWFKVKINVIQLVRSLLKSSVCVRLAQREFGSTARTIKEFHLTCSTYMASQYIPHQANSQCSRGTTPARLKRVRSTEIALRVSTEESTQPMVSTIIIRNLRSTLSRNAQPHVMHPPLILATDKAQSQISKKT